MMHHHPPSDRETAKLAGEMSVLAAKKGKEALSVSVASPAGDSSPDKRKGDSSTALRPSRLSSRNTSSKYDFVKVKVWLGDNADHYYVLSRFLLSRMLTVTKNLQSKRMIDTAHESHGLYYLDAVPVSAATATAASNLCSPFHSIVVSGIPL